ncbi:hypothetical protein IWQ56_002741, partial [Coemansia nantahalensis]
SQFVVSGPEAVMYPPHGYMPPYGYGYYQYPPQMAMGPPAPGAQGPASSPYMAPVYASGPYAAAPGYPSPVLAAAARSPGAASTLPRSQASSRNAATATPELGPEMLSGPSAPDSHGVMYGTPPLHMAMVPPPMPFGGMHAGGYMGPSAPLPQGYPPQQMHMPMGYAHYPPGQPYESSPPMVLMHNHTSPHMDHGAPNASHSPA